VLRNGDIVATDDAGRAALLLLIDSWTLDRLLAFDADPADLEDNGDLEDTDGEPEPDEEIEGPATVVDIVPPRRLGDALRIVPALALALLLVTVPHAVAVRPSTGRDAAALKRASADAVLQDLPQGAAVRRRLHQRDQAVQEEQGCACSAASDS
jgi:hypothetical protein